MTLPPDDPILTLRAQLAREIVRSLGGSYAPHLISARYGIPRPRMSELCRGKVQRCSVEWLIRRIHRMGGTVSLTIELLDENDRRRREAHERYRQRLAARQAQRSTGRRAT